MKRLLVAAILSVALLAGTRASVQATEFSIGLGFTLTFGTTCGPCDGGGCSAYGGSSCCKGCLPHPCWSGSYPLPVMYGGMMASTPSQGSYPSPSYGYPQYQGNYGGYNQGYAGMQQPPATPGISTIPPPSPDKSK